MLRSSRIYWPLVIGAGKAIYQANRLISAEPKENAVHQNSPPGAGKEFDHTIFDRLLSIYVDENGWVDYANLKSDRAQLDSYLGSLATAEPRRLSSDQEHLAFWIDAYNALTLGDVLESVFGKVKSVQSIEGFFNKRRHKVAGASLTLDEIEQLLASISISNSIRPRVTSSQILYAACVLTASVMKSFCRLFLNVRGRFHDHPSLPQWQELTFRARPGQWTEGLHLCDLGVIQS